MNINPLVWYSTRELKMTPPHFVQCNSPLTEDSLLWVMSKLQGRYTKHNAEDDDDDFLFSTIQLISFEDPAEAMLYELRWAGAK